MSTVCRVQSQSVNYLPTGKAVGTPFNNYPAISKKNAEELEYSEIRGNCFWDKEWHPALLLFKMGGDVKLKNVKLNLYTNNIHYINNAGAELVAVTNTTKIIFYDKKDTTKVTAIFQRFASFTEKHKESFIQVLAGGEIQLAKNYIVSLSKEFDPAYSRSKYRFRTKTRYLIINHGDVSPLKSINKASILSIIKPSMKQKEWLQSNNNKLKTETDAIAFLTFCNSNLKTQ